MKNNLDAKSQINEQLPRNSHAEGVRPLQTRIRIRVAAVDFVNKAVNAEDWRVVRDADPAMRPTAEAARRILQPELESVPAPLPVPPAPASLSLQPVAAPAHDSAAFLNDARSQVMASLPAQENYVPDHPRVDFGTAPALDPIAAGLDSLGYHQESAGTPQILPTDTQDNFGQAA